MGKLLPISVLLEKKLSNPIADDSPCMRTAVLRTPGQIFESDLFYVSLISHNYSGSLFLFLATYGSSIELRMISFTSVKKQDNFFKISPPKEK